MTMTRSPISPVTPWPVLPSFLMTELWFQETNKGTSGVPQKPDDERRQTCCELGSHREGAEIVPYGSDP
jgi:hypothetical protein